MLSKVLTSNKSQQKTSQHSIEFTNTAQLKLGAYNLAVAGVFAAATSAARLASWTVGRGRAPAIWSSARAWICTVVYDRMQHPIRSPEGARAVRSAGGREAALEANWGTTGGPRLRRPVARTGVSFGWSTMM
eukprot:SAG11_NODE_9108_length_942_cov_2.113879_2_plen_132_part_00